MDQIRMDDTAKIFADWQMFYKAIIAVEDAFKKSKPPQRVGKPQNATALGLKPGDYCVVRGPHVIYGYDGVVCATVCDVSWLQKEQNYIILADLAPRHVQAASAGGAPSSKVVRRTFCLMWDEAAPINRSLPPIDKAGLLEMLYRRVYFAPMCARIVHRKSGATEYCVVWVPGIYDRTLRKWDTDFFGMTFVHARPRALSMSDADTELGLFPVAHPVSSVGALRTYAKAQGQHLAPDLFCSQWDVQEPSAAAAQALRLKETSLPLTGPGPHPDLTGGPTREFLVEKQRRASEGDAQALAYLQALLPVYSESGGSGPQPVASGTRVKVEEVPVRMY